MTFAQKPFLQKTLFHRQTFFKVLRSSVKRNMRPETKDEPSMTSPTSYVFNSSRDLARIPPPPPPHSLHRYLRWRALLQMRVLSLLQFAYIFFHFCLFYWQISNLFCFFWKFLDDCTCKLGLTSKARCLYDWEGRVVDSFAKGKY